jgi:hypothetical protein
MRFREDEASVYEDHLPSPSPIRKEFGE